MHFCDPADAKANKDKPPKALPPLQVQICEGKHDVSIRVRIITYVSVLVDLYSKVRLLVGRDVLMLKSSHGLT